jgi:hypothetical protein
MAETIDRLMTRRDFERFGVPWDNGTTGWLHIEEGRAFIGLHFDETSKRGREVQRLELRS